MKKIWTNNDALKNLLVDNGIALECNDKMEIVISDEDAERVSELVDKLAPAASWDYGIENAE